MFESLYWLTQELSDMPENEDWLSQGERIRIAGMRFPKRRNDYKLGRWTAKRAICACQLGAVPRDSMLEIRAAEDGAPELYLNNAPGKFRISISHSRDRSLCVVGPPESGIGCDIEFIETRENDFFQDYFTPEELSIVEQNTFHDRALTSMLIWSSKETTLKILREGLRRDTRSVRIDPGCRAQEGTWNAWTGFCLQSSRTFYGWWRTCDGYVYTMASDRITASPDQLQVSFAS
jgi:4'-phosphopantetheinyl transferase